MFDLQINGFKTKDFECDFWNAANPADISALDKFLISEEVSNYLATIITNSFEQTIKNLEAIEQSQSSLIFGVHLEGGLISKLGVHDARYAQELNLKKFQDLVKKFPKLIKLVTLCPKLDSNGDITKFLQDSAIKVSYGHSDCDFDTAWNAFENYQVDLVTHWGNAMYVCEAFKQRNCSPEDLAKLESNNPQKAGLGLAAYHHEKVNIMAICGSKKNFDLHLDPLLIKKLFQKKKQKMILVSDMVHTENSEPKQLLGGLASLRTHYKNAQSLGISTDELDHATEILPRKLLST